MGEVNNTLPIFKLYKLRLIIKCGLKIGTDQYGFYGKRLKYKQLK
jgi:hypothetical protein